MDLYPHQVEALDAVQLNIVDGCLRQVVQMATGAGKTIWSAALADTLLLPDDRCLFLAHREDLLTQAHGAFQHYFPKEQLGIVQAFNNEPNARIVFGSFQTLTNPHRLAEVLRHGSFPLVVVDECHHAVAASYRKIIEEVGKKYLIGLTATPSRSDRQSLRKVFDRLTYSVGMLELITAEPPLLCDLKGVSIVTDLDLSSVGEDEHGDFDHRQLAEAVRKSKLRHQLAINALQKYAPGWQGLYFGADVHDARTFAQFANSAGIPTAVVLGTTKQDERQRIREAYLKGEIQFISNVQVMTEGTDLPPARVAVIGRPTRSQELYIQMVGRVTRILPDDRGRPVEQWQKDHALVIDLVDNRHTVLVLPDLIGTTEEHMGQKSVRQTVKEARDEGEFEPSFTTKNLSMQVAPSSLLSKRDWKRKGQNWYLKTKEGMALVEHDLGNLYWATFTTPQGKLTRLSKRALKWEHALATAEQHLDQLQAASKRREEQRINPAVRARPASPATQARITRMFSFLKTKQLIDDGHGHVRLIPRRGPITEGECRDWFDRAAKAKKVYGSWWQSPEKEQLLSGNKRTTPSAAKRSKPSVKQPSKKNDMAGWTFIEE